MKRAFPIWTIVIVAVGFIFILVFINYQISKQVDNIDKSSHQPVSKNPLVEPKKVFNDQPQISNDEAGFLVNQGKVTRVSRLGDIHGTYLQSIIYRGSVKVAEYKEEDEKIYDFIGDIPDGEVEFTDTAHATYGIENYENNKREGNYEEYFQGNNQLFKKGRYIQGHVLNMAEYGYEGTLKQEVKNQTF